MYTPKLSATLALCLFLTVAIARPVRPPVLSELAFADWFVILDYRIGTHCGKNLTFFTVFLTHMWL